MRWITPLAFCTLPRQPQRGSRQEDAPVQFEHQGPNNEVRVGRFVSQRNEHDAIGRAGIGRTRTRPAIEIRLPSAAVRSDWQGAYSRAPRVRRAGTTPGVHAGLSPCFCSLRPPQGLLSWARVQRLALPVPAAGTLPGHRPSPRAARQRRGRQERNFCGQRPRPQIGRAASSETELR